MSTAIDKYLRGYAEPEVRLLSGFPCDPGYQHVLVVPFYDELPESPQHILSRVKPDGRLLVIAVINAPQNGSTQALTNTRNILSRLCEVSPIQWESTNRQLQLQAFDANRSIDFLLVDRCTQCRTIPDDQGVGLARKIGNDLACQLIHQGVIKGPWIYQTDADTTLPTDYFAADPGLEYGAITYPFQHQPISDEWALPMGLYELSLHYYVEGLKWAGSPYAFHTVGSTLAFHYRSYAQVRGFPKRSAGEDFYLLNKVSKVAAVAKLTTPKLHIEGRPSMRVPFGTGPAIRKLAANSSPQEQAIFYHPDVFGALREWLLLLPQLWRMDHGQLKEDPVESMRTLLKNNPLQAHWLPIIKQLGAGKALKHCLEQCRDEAGFLRQMHCWFDGFRTLKFIHGMRDAGLASVTLGYATAHAPFVRDSAVMQSLLEQVSNLDTNNL